MSCCFLIPGAHRNLSKCNSKVESDAYTTLVQPILEYATQVWDPHQQNLIYKLEMVQRRAARWVQSDYSFQSSVTTMLDNLNWTTLEQRHKASYFTELLTSRSQHYKYPITFCHNPPAQDNTTHSRPILPAANTTKYQMNYFYRTIKEWNNLPSLCYDKDFVINAHTLASYL